MEMSRLTRDETAESVSRDQILRHQRGQGNIHFPIQLATCRTGNLTRLIHTLAMCVTIHYTDIRLLLTCPLHIISGCRKREAHVNWSMVVMETQHPLLELPCQLLALCGRTLGCERHRYGTACPDKLGTDTMAYGGFYVIHINGRHRGNREESRK